MGERSRETRFNLSEAVSAIRWSQNAISKHRVCNEVASDDAESDGSKQILLVHGCESRATQMFGLVKGLIQQGYSVFAVNMPGHGHSFGDTSNAYFF